MLFVGFCPSREIEPSSLKCVFNTDKELLTAALSTVCFGVSTDSSLHEINVKREKINVINTSLNFIMFKFRVNI